MYLKNKYVSKKSVEYFNRGNFKFRLKEYTFSIKDFDKAIEISPEFAEAYCRRGEAKSLTGDHFEAVKDYNKAIDIILNKY
ncbi:MAG: tetratricopeptide repeat protein [Ignavibacteriaceae bacterium]|jgi:tetratricopeptide (TPR) repeat protein